MANTAQALSASLEDYLEAVLELVRRGGVARVRDIASRLGVHMPSVTAALKALARRGLVNYVPYEYVTLTERGLQCAQEVSGRHDMLRRFFADVLGLDSAQAEANACRIEHVADADLLARLAAFAEFVRRCPRAGQDWVAAFGSSCADRADAPGCRQCIRDAIARLDSQDAASPLGDLQ